MKKHNLSVRFNDETFLPEVNIEGCWVNIESIVDTKQLYDYETFIEMFRTDYGDGVAEWLKENYKEI